MDWTADASAAIKIRSDRHDSNDDDLAAGIGNALTKDGQSQPTADIGMNGKKLINLGDPVNPTDAASKKYVDAIRSFATNLDLSGADANGRINFTSATGANGITWTGADLSWLARLATVGPPATQNRLVLNTKPDGSGTDVIQMREDGSGVFSASVRAKAVFSVQADTGNVHLYFLGPADVTRGILYTNAAANGAMVLNTTAYGNYTFASTLTLPGGSYHDSNGNIVGTIWSNWGYSDAYNAISARIESRAQAWANQVGNSCAQNSRVNSEIAFRRSGVTTKWENSSWLLTGVKGDSAGGDAIYYARQFQVYYPAQGWVTGANFT
jgi:hypothetical protein